MTPETRSMPGRGDGLTAMELLAPSVPWIERTPVAGLSTVTFPNNNVRSSSTSRPNGPRVGLEVELRANSIFLHHDNETSLGDISLGEETHRGPSPLHTPVSATFPWASSLHRMQGSPGSKGSCTPDGFHRGRVPVACLLWSRSLAAR